MNASLQRFDIGFQLDEKLQELTECGMSESDAVALIRNAVNEWIAVHAPTTNSSGDVWVIDAHYGIKACNRRAVQSGQMWFETWVDAAQCLASMARQK